MWRRTGLRLRLALALPALDTLRDLRRERRLRRRRRSDDDSERDLDLDLDLDAERRRLRLLRERDGIVTALTTAAAKHRHYVRDLAIGHTGTVEGCTFALRSHKGVNKHGDAATQPFTPQTRSDAT